MGRTKIELGLAHETVTLIERAIAISPTDAALDFWCYWAGMAALYVGDNETALEWLRRSHQANRAYDNTLRLMAVALARTGREAEARAKVAEFLKLQPQFTVGGYWYRPREQHPVVARQRARIADTLRELGVPEGKRKRASAP
jgi:tetratricopeptide (TPR) repeat protein